jgi:hypothetical protein
VDLLLARHEAENFFADYTDAVDRRDFTALHAVVADATVVIQPAGMTVDGGAAVAALYRRVLPPTADGHHLVTNLRVRLAEDAVTAECRYHFIGGPQLRIQVLGRYRTDFIAKGHRLVPVRHRVVREFEAAADVDFATGRA